MARDLKISRVYGIREEAVDDSTAFLTPKVERLHRWWRSLAVGRLPLRREFDILDHWPLISDLFLVEARADGQFLMRLEGESVIRLFGAHNAGRLISEATGVGEYGHALHEYYAAIVEDRTCRRCVGSLEHVNDRAWIEFESIDCPLSRDGDRVDYILGAMAVVRSEPLASPPRARRPALTGP